MARCLSCAVKFADEIIVVDTGSTDGTVAEAKKFTDKVYRFKWVDDFSAARNFAFGKATQELVMWLDADDVITDENCRKIAILKENFTDYDMAVLPYAAAFENGKPTFVYNRERIFRRSLNYKFKGAVHEAVQPRGRIFYGDAVIYHAKVKEKDPLRNLKIFQNMIMSGKSLDGRQKFYYGRELLSHKMYTEAIAVLKSFIDGEGWVINKCEACVDMYLAYNAVGKPEKAFASVLKSLEFAPPNSRICCIIGDKFLKSGDYAAAVYWFEAALSAPSYESQGAFVNKDYLGYIPYMQLCVLYDKLGDKKKAFECNEAAGRIKPYDSNYMYNKKYFENIGIRGI